MKQRQWSSLKIFQSTLWVHNVLCVKILPFNNKMSLQAIWGGKRCKLEYEGEDGKASKETRLLNEQELATYGTNSHFLQLCFTMDNTHGMWALANELENILLVSIGMKFWKNTMSVVWYRQKIIDNDENKESGVFVQDELKNYVFLLKDDKHRHYMRLRIDNISTFVVKCCIPHHASLFYTYLDRN